jgi:hypothetical protein
MKHRKNFCSKNLRLIFVYNNNNLFNILLSFRYMFLNKNIKKQKKYLNG